MRESTIPAENLHNDRFLNIWKEKAVKHELRLIGLIIEEERIQLHELEVHLQERVKILDEYQDLEKFEKCNDSSLRKEVEEFHKTQKIGKQKLQM